MNNRMLRKSLVLLSLGALVLGFGWVGRVAAASATGPSDTAQIESVIAQAEFDKLSLIAPGVSHFTPSVPQAVLASAKGRAEAAMRTLYSPSSPLLQTRIDQLDHALSMQSHASFTALAGGIRDLKFTSLTVSGTGAQASVTFTAFSTVASEQPDGTVAEATPTNNMIGQIELVKNGSTWQIQREVLQFAPGSLP